MKTKIIRECSDCGKKGDQGSLFLFLTSNIWTCNNCLSRNTGIVLVEKKKKKEKPTYNNIEFDSHEEIWFYQWCEEAKHAGLIFDFIYQPPSYTLSTKQTYIKPVQLKTKVRYDERELLKPHVYTADFKLFCELGALNDIFFVDECQELIEEVLIDVKGKFQQFHDGKLFAVNQKWLYDKHGVYVNKVIPDDLFLKTWIPDNARYTLKTKKLKKAYIDFKSIGDYLSRRLRL